MDKNFMDIYTDYLISSFSSISATRLSLLLDNNISHDKITRFLSNESFTSKDFWKLVKPAICKYEEKDAVIAIDDTILEKPTSKAVCTRRKYTPQFFGWNSLFYDF